MRTVKSILKGRELRRFIMYSLRFLPDAWYVSLHYWAAIGKWPNLKHPHGYTEKLQWLKLNEDYSKYRDYCDKIKVRSIIKEKLGDGYMFPLLGQWKTFDEIDFSKLPEDFVLKCNHDSGSVKIIRNRSSLTGEELLSLKRFFDSRMKHDFFYEGREPVYKGIERWIFAEELMQNTSEDNSRIKDYKFFCFDGKPEIMYVSTDRDTVVKDDFFDMSFCPLDVSIDAPHSNKKIEKPKQFEEMKRLAEVLSHGMKHVRIDFYEINGRLYFGEFTFFSGAGFELFKPQVWEEKFGNMIKTG